MLKSKPQVLIVYESGSLGLKQAAETIAARLMATHLAIVKPAREVTVPDVLASSSFAFGADSCDEAEWAELRRMLKGINLAGRSASLFSPKANQARNFLQAMLVDSDITVVPEIVDPSAVAGPWLETLRRA